MIAFTVLIALSFTSCASSRKQTRVLAGKEIAATGDSTRSARRGLVMEGIPASTLTLEIPVPELLALPAGASYNKKSERVGVNVETRGDTLVVTSTCDSLQRLVLWYEEELTRIRDETVKNVKTVETGFKRRFNPVQIALIAFIAGLASGMVLIVLKKRLHE